MHDWHSSETHFLRWALRPQQVFKWEPLYQKWQNFNLNQNITLKCGPLIFKVFEYIFMGRYIELKYRYHWNRLSLFNMSEFESDPMSLRESAENERIGAEELKCKILMKSELILNTEFPRSKVERRHLRLNLRLFKCFCMLALSSKIWE